MRRTACLLLAAGTATGLLHKYKEHEHMMTERSKQPFHFQHRNTVEVPHDYYGSVQKSTFRSPVIKLKSGPKGRGRQDRGGDRDQGGALGK